VVTYPHLHVADTPTLERRRQVVKGVFTQRLWAEPTIVGKVARRGSRGGVGSCAPSMVQAWRGVALAEAIT